MPISDLTGYTWVGNNDGGITVDLPETENGYQINFTSNNTTFSSINSWLARGRILYGADIVYSGGSWANQAYRTIEITGGTDATNSTLISWLEANGTLTSPSPTPSSNKISIGNLNIENITLGNANVKVYLGNIELYDGTNQ